MYLQMLGERDFGTLIYNRAIVMIMYNHINVQFIFSLFHIKNAFLPVISRIYVCLCVSGG